MTDKTPTGLRDYEPVPGTPEWWEKEKLRYPPYTGSQPIAEFEAEKLASSHSIIEWQRERRNRIAEGFAVRMGAQGDWDPSSLALRAIRYADALIAELDK